MVAVTFDDLPCGGLDPGLARVQAMTDALLAHIRAGAVPAAGFVNPAKLGEGPERAPRVGLLQQWADAGLELGNHTDSHPDLQRTPVEEVEADVIRGEPVIRAIDAAAGRPLRWFRHPYLHTGPSAAVRARFEAFLAGRGYTVAPVTIDTADWLFAAVYADAKGRGDAATMQEVGAAYVTSMGEALSYSERAAQALFGRPIRHVLLLHANELNADFFDDVVALYQARGYRFVALAEALADPAYAERDGYVGPEGVSWLHRWERTRRHEGRAAPGQGADDWGPEPTIPDFVRTRFETRAAGSL